MVNIRCAFATEKSRLCRHYEILHFRHILKQRDLFLIKQVSFGMIFYIKRVLLAIFPYLKGGDHFVERTK